MRYSVIIIYLLAAVSAHAQAPINCNNTNFGQGWACRQMGNIFSSPYVASLSLSLPAVVTTGNGVFIISWWQGSGVTNISDNVGDTGFQPCNLNPEFAGTQTFRCWWLPQAGAGARTFTVTYPSGTGINLQAAEWAGGCIATSGCINDFSPLLLLGNCSAAVGGCARQITTTTDNELVLSVAGAGLGGITTTYFPPFLLLYTTAFLGANDFSFAGTYNISFYLSVATTMGRFFGIAIKPRNIPVGMSSSFSSAPIIP